MKRLFAALLCFWTVVAAAVPADVSWPEQVEKTLTDGGCVIVEYQSGGCFHFEKCELVFRLAEDRMPWVAVAEISIGDDGKAKGRAELGTVKLTYRDYERFAKLLEFYRNLPKDWSCTTTNRMVFRLNKSAAPIAQLEDSTCETRQRLDLLTFEEIIDRVRNREAKK